MFRFPKVLQDLKGTFESGVTKPLAWRKQQLKQMQLMLNERYDQIVAAAAEDLHRHEQETYAMEIGICLSEIDNFLTNLDKYCQPEKVHKILMNARDTVEVRKEPKGVVLIITCWNVPFLLAIQGLAGVIAAGNCAVLKPSELVPKSAQTLHDIINEYLDDTAVKVILGGPLETNELLSLHFDHILFTGSERVGRIVAKKAADKLIPVTLELGGKTPLAVDSNINHWEQVANRVTFGAFLSNGQACCAVDYVLCLEDVYDEFLKKIVEVLKKFYGDNAEESPSYARIGTESNFNRLSALLRNTRGQIYYGGKVDKSTHYIEPTLLVDIDGDDPIMKEEVFGPILPVLKVTSIEDAIGFIKKRPHPLAAYIFSENKAVVGQFMDEVTAGGMLANDTMMIHSTDNLPKGGLGHSGMGRYTGKMSIDEFSNHKSVLVTDLKVPETLISIRYPPFSASKLKWVKLAMNRRMVPDVDWLIYVLLVVIGWFLHQLYAKYIGGTS